MDGDCIFEIERNEIGKEYTHRNWVSVCTYDNDMILFTFNNDIESITIIIFYF